MTVLNESNVARRIGGAFSLVLTTAFVVVILATASLGTEIAVSNAQTKSYSAGAVAIGLLYLVGAVVLPIVIVQRGFRSQRRTRLQTLRLAAAVSFCVQLVFIPFALVLFAM